MPITSNLRRQHTEILGLASKILEAIKATPPALEKIAELLPSLTGRVTIHLTMEDNGLYPKLLNSGDPKIRQTAADFIAEMGNFKKAFGDYNEKWNSILKVKNNIEEFNRETQMIMTALIRRINQEDRELYDLADRMYN